jgi:hypothetical protein
MLNLLFWIIVVPVTLTFALGFITYNLGEGPRLTKAAPKPNSESSST